MDGLDTIALAHVTVKVKWAFVTNQTGIVNMVAMLVGPDKTAVLVNIKTMNFAFERINGVFNSS